MISSLNVEPSPLLEKVSLGEFKLPDIASLRAERLDLRGQEVPLRVAAREERRTQLADAVDKYNEVVARFLNLFNAMADELQKSLPPCTKLYRTEGPVSEHQFREDQFIIATNLERFRIGACPAGVTPGLDFVFSEFERLESAAQSMRISILTPLIKDGITVGHESMDNGKPVEKILQDSRPTEISDDHITFLQKLFGDKIVELKLLPYCDVLRSEAKSTLVNEFACYHDGFHHYREVTKAHRHCWRVRFMLAKSAVREQPFRAISISNNFEPNYQI